MAGKPTELPPCGLYLTTRPLSGREEEFPAGLIVSFHNHSDSGLPTVTKPDHNILNRWHFHGPAVQLRGLSWVSSLERLADEGFYTLRKEIHFEGGSWPRGTLVQLGYTQAGEPILFIARVPAKLERNELVFSDRGAKIKRADLRQLEPASVFTEPGSTAADGAVHDHGHQHG
ncbi:MAG: hypothetical protein HY908_35600 [Myxococcales bacterium]|nr:hypothetical protein [Myxococcales bacterium]